MSVFDRLIVRGRAVFKMNAAAETNTVGVPDGTLRLYNDGTNSFIQVFSRRVDSTGAWETFNPAALLPPTTADYLVGTSNASLPSAIVAGASPGGELGGTWATPTVDGTHSGSAHHADSHTVASHTDTTATGAELETLTDGSNADSLHTHAAGPTRIYKTADETVTSSTTLQDDNHLSFAVASSIAYAVKGVLLYRADTTPDIKVGWNVPSGATFMFRKSDHGSGGAHVTTYWDDASSPTVAGAGITSPALVGVIVLDGIITTSSTSGTAQLRWAQQTSDAVGTVMRIGSYIEYEAVS